MKGRRRESDAREREPKAGGREQPREQSRGAPPAADDRRRGGVSDRLGDRKDDGKKGRR